MIPPIILLTISWSLLFLALQKFNRNCSSEWNNRICSIIHGIIVTRYTEYNIEWPWNFDNMNATNTPWQETVLLICCSYFVFDTACCLCIQSIDLMMIIHHVVSLWCSLSSYYYGVSGYETIIAMWLSEFTNPLFHMRWFLRSMEWHQGKLALVNNVLFAVLFLFSRMVLGTYAWYTVVFVKNTPCFIWITSCMFQTVNVVFSYQIVSMVKRRIMGKANANDDAKQSLK